MEMQGRVFETKAAENLSDSFKEALTILKVHGIISYSEADRASNRLVKWLAKNTKPNRIDDDTRAISKNDNDWRVKTRL